jgi:Domain of unknown function (DUF1918)
MTATPGDQMVVHSSILGHPDRTGEILEVRGEEGGPPYMVRWDESGHITLFYPGTDCSIVHRTRSAA